MGNRNLYRTEHEPDDNAEEDAGDEVASYDDDIYADARAAFAEVSQAEPPAPPVKPAGGDPVAPPPPPADAADPVDTRTDAEKARDEKGRFAPKAKAPAAEVAPPEQTPADAAKPADAAPPTSWGAESKALWASLPAPIRAEVAKREAEMQAGMQHYAGLGQYAEEAKRHNVTIKSALDRYTALDRLCHQDLTGGIIEIARVYGKTDPASLGELFSGLAQRFGAKPATSTPTMQQNQNGQAQEPDPIAEMLQPYLQPLLTQVKTITEQRAEADRNAQVQTFTQAIDAFAADPKNEYYSRVQPAIADLFRRGVVPTSGNPAADLKTAYDMAVRLDEGLQQELIEKRVAEALEAQRKKGLEAVAKARGASKSVGGSSVAGIRQVPKVPTGSRGSYDEDLEADVRAAFAAHAS